MSDIPQAVKIIDIKKENKLSKTYTLDISLGAKPGQFVNLWIPGVNEKPFSVGMDDGKKIELMIAAVGPFTKELEKMKVGDKVGIRGAYGTSFTYSTGDKIICLAGGYGVAPLYFLSYLASQDDCEIDFIIGARNKGLLSYHDRVAKLSNVHLHIATDDGSEGYHGYGTDIMKEIVDAKSIASIKTCGPEMMMKSAMDIAFERVIDCEIDMERYMKCGFGICGNCVNDGTGAPSCKKGTVMKKEYVKECTDFGSHHRDSVGEKMYYD